MESEEMTHEFVAFDKISRISRPMVVTEKLDGTNAQIYIAEDDTLLVGSRKRWIAPGDDNYGFARWVSENEGAIREALGYGRHYGEWWGQGIQRRYGMDRKVFSLFNTSRWKEDDLPPCLSVVPVLYEGEFSTTAIDLELDALARTGSIASPGFDRPEGVVVYLSASNTLMKKTLDKNDGHKWEQK